MSIDGTSPPEPAPEPTAGDDGDGWRRLDARMLLVHPVEILVRLLPAILLLLIAGAGGGDFPWQPLLALPVAVGLGTVR